MFYPIGFYRQPTTSMAAVSDGGYFHFCANCITRLPSFVFDVKIRYVICLFVVMSAVTGRTHVNWRYRTLKARRDSTCGVRLGLLLRSFIRVSLFALQTQICLLLII